MRVWLSVYVPAKQLKVLNPSKSCEPIVTNDAALILWSAGKKNTSTSWSAFSLSTPSLTCSTYTTRQIVMARSLVDGGACGRWSWQNMDVSTAVTREHRLSQCLCPTVTQNCLSAWIDFKLCTLASLWGTGARALSTSNCLIFHVTRTAQTLEFRLHMVVYPEKITLLVSCPPRNKSWRRHWLCTVKDSVVSYRSVHDCCKQNVNSSSLYTDNCAGTDFDVISPECSIVLADTSEWVSEQWFVWRSLWGAEAWYGRCN